VYAAIYNRLCGWSLLGIAIIGYTVGHLGDYVDISASERHVVLALGIISILGARCRPRYSTPIAMFLGLILAVWGLWGILSPSTIIGYAEPLESAIRIVAGGWGCYVAIQDFFTWRQSSSSSIP
jgi:hypothetical protein